MGVHISEILGISKSTIVHVINTPSQLSGCLKIREFQIQSVVGRITSVVQLWK
jgi:hypothetical protein